MRWRCMLVKSSANFKLLDTVVASAFQASKSLPTDSAPNLQAFAMGPLEI